jgi:hypothetical protein
VAFQVTLWPALLARTVGPAEDKGAPPARGDGERLPAAAAADEPKAPATGTLVAPAPLGSPGDGKPPLHADEEADGFADELAAGERARLGFGEE